MQTNAEAGRPAALSPAPHFDQVERERSAMNRYGRFQFVHWFVLFSSVLLTLGVWQFTRAQHAQTVETRFEFEATHTTEFIIERLQKYELALWGGVSAIKQNGDQMERAEWKEFADNLEISERYPGINGIGVIHEVEPEELDSYLAHERQSLPSYGVHPRHDKDIYRPITFIEPIDINAAAVGLDMAHETNRNTALTAARDTGKALITAPIVLVQDQDKTPGFLFFAPLYEGHQTETLRDRQSTFLGAVYAPFIVHKLIEGALHKDRRFTTIKVSDGDQVIYDETDPNDPDFDPNPIAQTRVSLPVYGRTWDIDFRTGMEFRHNNRGSESNAILFFGGLIDLALLGLFVMLTRAYQRGIKFADIATKALDHEAQALKEANTALEVARAEAEGVSQMKSNFLATMSHEVRTPLTAISGILVLLERADKDKQNGTLLQAARASAEKLMKLLTSVLDISRLEANAVKLWERSVPLRPLVEEWALLANGIVETAGKEIKVVTEVAPDTPQNIVVDDIRLSQVMNNLIDNAARFTDEGHIRLGVSYAENGGDIPATVTFSIADTGLGIPKSEQPHIFDRFRQVDGTITRQNEGTGLGLAICKDLVKLMGGSITLQSSPATGTLFEVILPAKQA